MPDTSVEKQIFEAIAKNDTAALKILLVKSGSVDITDDNGMTALQHACYKGNKDAVRLLLDRVSPVVLQIPTKLAFLGYLLSSLKNNSCPSFFRAPTSAPASTNINTPHYTLQRCPATLRCAL